MTTAAPGPRDGDGRELPCPEVFEAWLGDSVYDVQLGAGARSGTRDDVASGEAARRFREVLGRFASGVTVVTAMSGRTPVGLTCQSFSSVSLDPPLVLFVPARSSRAWPLIRAAGVFCVNILAADQTWVSNRMAGRGQDKFAGLEWSASSVTGSPVLPGVLGHVDCTVESVHEAGDHDVVVGRVVDLVAQGGVAERDPLLFYRGRYRTTG